MSVTESMRPLPLFRRTGAERTAGGVAYEDEAAVRSDTGRPILCAACRGPVTTETQRIAVQGQHDHTFVNPHGIAFHIGCFREAPGCRYVGEATSDWTWFSGYTWRIALCAHCRAHLGWLYQGSNGSRFHGLILDKLVREEGDEAR